MNKILIIRNEPDTLSDLGKLLCGDFDILETSSGKEAIEILQSEDYNVSAIILSAYLSCDNSFSLLDALCNNIKSTRIPVIAAVKAEDDSVVERAFALGACDCISAPYKPLIIKQRIANAVKLYKAEDEADESHDDMRLANQLVEDSSSSVYVCDANTYEMLYVNKNCARMCGKRVGEAKGKRCYEFLKNASKPCTPCYMETTVYNEYTEREYSSPPTGKHYITRGKFIDWGGRKALVEYFIDETERITQQNQLQDLVNKIPGGIGIYELYPDGSMKLVYLNDGYYSLIGTQRENRAEYFNSSFSAAMHPDDVARAKNDLLSVLDGTRTSNTDFRVMSGSGEYKWLNARSRVAHKTDEKATIYVTYTDIDQEKKNHLQLEASRHVLSLANQEGQVSLWLYDIDNRRVVYNFISGIPESVENIPQRLISEGLVQPEDAKTFLDAYERMFSAAQRSECLVRMLNNKSGAYEWYHLVLSRLKDNYFGGNMAFGMATNVNTQQKTRIRYERELILRNELLKDAIVYTVVNLTTGLFEEYQDNVGEDYSAKPAIALDEAIEHEILQRIDEADRELVKASVFPAALREIYKAGESTSSCVFRRKVSGGTTHWVKATVNILPKPDTGDIVAFMYITDIDSEVKDKQALECVIGEEIESICVIDASSGMAHTLVSDSQPFSMPKGQQFKYSDVAESFISNRIIEEDRAASAEFFKLENMLSALKSSPSDFFTFRTRHADGSLHWNRTLIFHSDASQSCLVMSRRDITRLYDEEQQQKQVLQKAVAAANEANQAKSDFLSRISHDMRTPLNAVIGLTGLAKEEKNPPKTAEYLDNIEDSGKLLLELINDILDLSRIESGETELVLEPYSLAEFKRNIDSVIRPLMDKKNIQFICQLNADVDNICVDKMRFCQIFLNLLTNSAKFTQSGGRVEFISEHIPDDELGRYGLRFYVRDTGRGMSESFLSRLFLPFTQENSSPELQGSGLGLAIVKRLVDSFGGTISVKSELGKGTEFVIDLHAHHESNIPGTAKSANEDFSHLFGKHILLVEDNMINTLVAKALLESKGCEVDTALNGLESISKFETSENGFYDAILMDVRMPVMDGIEATQRISRLKRQEAKTIPIIAMTANAFSEDHEQTMQAGMNAHLSKPIDPSQLFNTILSLIK